MVNQVAHANGITVNNSADPNGMRRPVAITAVKVGSPNVSLWQSGAYAYDGAGNVVTIGASSYYYDLVGRLVSSTVNTSAMGTATVTQAYTYDAFGNIQSINGSTGGRTTTTSSTTNRLATAGTSYDDSGNMTFWNGQSYQYDPFHQPWRTVTGEEWIHLYTADDERLWSYQVTGGEKNRWTIRDLDGRVLREYGYNRPTNTWSVTGDYVYRDGLLLARDTNIAGTVRHFHLDHLGTPRLITNGSGSQVAYHAYYPFGEEATGVTQDTERMKFTGHERDLNSQGGSNPAADDLDYMHQRFHNPQLGRFLSVDPMMQAQRAMKQPQLWNRYSYALNNPLLYVDPEGKTPGVPTADKGDCSGLAAFSFGCIRQAISNWLNEKFAPPAADPEDPNVQALTEEYGEAREHPYTAAGLVQEGLNEATADIAAGAASAAIIIGGPSAINVTTKGFGHAVMRHTVVGRAARGVSVFRAEENLVALARAAEGVRPIPQANRNLAFVVNAGRVVGHDARANGPTTFYTVVTDARRNLVTIHPGLPSYMY